MHRPAVDDFGKYDYAVGVKDGALGELLTHRTTLARLPHFPEAPLEPDLRSRFCVWWWNGAHRTFGEGAAVDPIDWLGVGYALRFGSEGGDRIRQRGVRAFKEDAVSCMHEFNVSASHVMRYPALMLGEPRYQLTEDEEKKFQAQWDENIELCRRMREERPGTQIVFGNSTFASVEEFLYRGFPGKLFDAVGHEACGLMRMPERQPELAAFLEVYWFQRALEEYGYPHPLWAWFEWLYHSTNPGNHTWQEQSDLYVRDMLHGLSYNLVRICPAEVEDAGNGYYWSN